MRPERRSTPQLRGQARQIRREIDRLTGLVERKGQTVVPTALYFSKGRVKVEIGIATGKRQHDKRKVQKDRDWERDRARVMKAGRDK